MPIPPDEVQRIAALAKFKLSPEGISHLSDELLQIIDYFDAFKEVNRSAVESRGHVFDGT